jgi:hypothetical protein
MPRKDVTTDERFNKSLQVVVSLWLVLRLEWNPSAWEIRRQLIYHKVLHPIIYLCEPPAICAWPQAFPLPPSSRRRRFIWQLYQLQRHIMIMFPPIKVEITFIRRHAVVTTLWTFVIQWTHLMCAADSSSNCPADTAPSIHAPLPTEKKLIDIRW